VPGSGHSEVVAAVDFGDAVVAGAVVGTEAAVLEIVEAEAEAENVTGTGTLNHVDDGAAVVDVAAGTRPEAAAEAKLHIGYHATAVKSHIEPTAPSIRVVGAGVAVVLEQKKN
jgi:hypothetical protein